MTDDELSTAVDAVISKIQTEYSVDPSNVDLISTVSGIAAGSTIPATVPSGSTVSVKRILMSTVADYLTNQVGTKLAEATYANGYLTITL